MPTSDPGTVLAATGAWKAFARRSTLGRSEPFTVLEDVSVAVSPGRTTALVGESGSGKTTLGRIMTGLIEPDRGQVSFAGRPVRGMTRDGRREFRRGVQMVFQNPLRSFSPMLSVGATLRDALVLRPDVGRGGRRAAVAELLAQVRLDPSFAARRPGEMSGGQLQRVGVARALAPDPAVVVLDEPTSALDMSLRGEVVNLLLGLQRERGIGYLLISHDLRVAQAMADEVVVLYLGTVLEQGPSARVLRDPAHPYTRALLAAAPGRQTGSPDGVSLRGEVVRPADGDTGCKLRTRCPMATTGCERPQVLRPIGDGSTVRCWRVAPPEAAARPDPAPGRAEQGEVASR